MLSSFLIHLKKEYFLEPSDKILLTVSGGIDSVVMCDLFYKGKLNFAIAHCNFQLRGQESDGDEKFVKVLAKKYNVELFTVKFDTSKYAKSEKLSIQVAARELRYNWFEKVRKESGFKYIATAHHQDDSIETFFINLIRGTGIKGLHGILPQNGNIIRPLLFCNKKEITAYAEKNKLKYREDSSNVSDKYLRNKIRHKIIPALKELNPQLEETILNNISHLREVEQIYELEVERQRDTIVTSTGDQWRISIPLLKSTKTPKTFLHEFLIPFHFNEPTVDEIISALTAESGKQFLSPTHRLIKDRDFLIIEVLESNSQQSTVNSLKVEEDQKEIVLEKIKLLFQKSSTFKVQRSNLVAQLDFDKLKFPLEIRTWQKGDTFYPLGMKGKKKLSDFFIDRKFSIHEKENVLLLLSDHEIIWVIGQRIDDRFKITQNTKKIYVVEIQ